MVLLLCEFVTWAFSCELVFAFRPQGFCFKQGLTGYGLTSFRLEVCFRLCVWIICLRFFVCKGFFEFVFIWDLRVYRGAAYHFRPLRLLRLLRQSY